MSPAVIPPGFPGLPDTPAIAPTGDQLMGKALWTTRSAPAIILSQILIAISTKYGLGWSDETVAILVFAIGTVVAYVMRVYTSVPVVTLFSKPTQPVQKGYKLRF